MFTRFKTYHLKIVLGDQLKKWTYLKHTIVLKFDPVLDLTTVRGV